MQDRISDKVRPSPVSSSLSKGYTAPTDTHASWWTKWESDRRIDVGQKRDNIIRFAMQKLSNSNDAVLRSGQMYKAAKWAVLSTRLSLDFESAQYCESARQMEANQVASHMRILYSVPKHREYMRSGTPSEPILAEAAAISDTSKDIAPRYDIAAIGCSPLIYNVVTNWRVTKDKWTQLIAFRTWLDELPYEEDAKLVGQFKPFFIKESFSWAQSFKNDNVIEARFEASCTEQKDEEFELEGAGLLLVGSQASMEDFDFD